MKSSRAIISLNIMLGEAQILSIPDGEAVPPSSEEFQMIGVWTIILNNCCFLWIADGNNAGAEAELSKLVIGMADKRFSDTGALTSTLLQSDNASTGTTDEYAESLTRRLAMKFGMQFLVSESLQKYYSSPELLLSIERTLFPYLKTLFTEQAGL
jgi:hypothetical protein